MSAASDILKLIKEKEIEFVDLRFTDPRGKLQHMTQDLTTIDEDFLNDGTFFDGSSIAGWKAINESDMILKPDLSRTFVDPFTSHNTLVIFCDIMDPIKNDYYERDPRSIAKKAEAYLKTTGIGDTIYFGPEPEFFIFDDVKISNTMQKVSFQVDSNEGPYNGDKEYPNGNMGHRPVVKGGYFPVPPVDSCQDLRAEALKAMKDMGVKVEKHHHEVAPSQHELGTMFDTMVRNADNMQIYKYAVQMVAHSFGKTATFMAKPIKGDNGSGMHCHQSIWKAGKPLFAGDKYAGLSQECLYYIGGIIKHAKALNAFTNSTTNSYKRLIPGFEAPVILAYSARNRSASCRIPFSSNPKGKRVEVRFPDAAGNPYLTFASMLMAGIDGIKNKIDPGKPFDKDLYSLSAEELKGVPQVCGSLREALENLDKDRSFLTSGGVFTDDQIDAYIELKMTEVYNMEHTPHPVEYQMYYSC
ncbi:GlnA Glutamine synthetase [Candidatus Pelagibacterales bacterium]|jgi:glutamine synthetase|nr:type I glutamate--ammonia ligase [Candidatus Fonsibacter sp.]MBU3733657.1 type I glutamate--ammonia ligase [Candidatus Fonsibacter sp.]MCF8523567.1 type I glutamate--ammonia ligase [Candidatus Fonsibacter sp.]